MSYSSELKKHLQTLGFKKECCMLACSAGYEGQTFENSCPNCTGSFLRGVFFRFGYLSPPEKEALLTFTFYDDYASYVRDVLVNAGIEAKVSDSRDRKLIYLKKNDAIADLVSMMGATKFSLELMNAQIDKQFRSELNRKVNADTANLRRAAEAGAIQRAAILKLERAGKLTSLPDELQATAALRLRYPEANLKELSSLSVPAVTKSGLNHRLQKLVQIAEDSE